MLWYAEKPTVALKTLSGFSGLDGDRVIKSRIKHGENILKKQKKDGIFKRIISALLEPMILILLISALFTLAINFGRFLKTGEADFAEVSGIIIAVVLSTAITVIMESSSQKAFEQLSKSTDTFGVKVIRNGVLLTVKREDIVVGDLMMISAGDKIVADARLIESTALIVDESALTGESLAVRKNADIVLPKETHLAERVNMVYSGTFVVGGDAKCVVTGVGNLTEIGQIASELSSKKEVSSPLNQKLSRLGKTIAIIGGVVSFCVFLLSVLKLIVTGNFTFFALQETFISCIVLIVATVPEGLPSIVAVSLALGMLKLAKKRALIKKLVATETVGAVSVICSDKTGTLTENKMTVERLIFAYKKSDDGFSVKDLVDINCAVNSTAELSKVGGKETPIGSATEIALLCHLKANGVNYNAFRSSYKVIDKIPFSSDIKKMQTTTVIDGKRVTLIKGAPEVILGQTKLAPSKTQKFLSDIKREQDCAKRVICFAHSVDGEVVFDGYAVISDAIRKDAYRAVLDAQSAGIEVKILTGDNLYTAIAVAKELGIIISDSQAVNASDIARLTDGELKKVLPKIKVIARSTPSTKLRVVKALKELGEVVAVTGDGINDAPAIRHADVGIAMGKTGAEITKETADIVLLDDAFSTIITAVGFGRSVYKNLQRFILFQLTVNISALLIIVTCLVLGLPSPFNTLQLLWINVIMDGPPALTLGLEPTPSDILKQKPVKRSDGLVGKGMLFRIIISAVYIAVVTILQYAFDFLSVGRQNLPSVVFTLFITFQLFNAFNARETGAKSMLKNLTKNKIMPITFLLTFILHFLIVTFAYEVFGVAPMDTSCWLKTIALGFSIIMLTEGYKYFYRKIFQKTRKLK